MSQFLVGRRSGATVGGDVVFDVKTVRWIFDVFNEKHQVAEFEVVHEREKAQRNKTRFLWLEAYSFKLYLVAHP